MGGVEIPRVREVARGLDYPNYYIAGLPEMIEEMVRALQELVGIPEEDLDWELFRGY